MDNFRTLTGLGAITVIFVAIMTSFSWENETRLFRQVSDRIQAMPFDLSCSPEGNVIDGSGGNCLEKNGYRFIRVGLAGTIIARIDPDGPNKVVYRRGIDDDLRPTRGLIGAWLALSPCSAPSVAR